MSAGACERTPRKEVMEQLSTRGLICSGGDVLVILEDADEKALPIPHKTISVDLRLYCKVKSKYGLVELKCS